MSSPPVLEQRTLRLDPNTAGFYYQYEGPNCVKQVLFICTQREMKRDTYDLRDQNVRNQLIARGFVAVVRQKP